MGVGNIGLIVTQAIKLTDHEAANMILNKILGVVPGA